MDEKQSANGQKNFMINHPVDEQPELISERAIEDIKFVLERDEPLTDEDLEELGREYKE
jgi:hypothetical protein